jgi:hypothetical protein
MRGTRSVGITLLFWLAGAIYTIAGTHLNIEFGLTTPRHKFEGVEQGIPRSGGTLNYVRVSILILLACSFFMRAVVSVEEVLVSDLLA